MVAGDDSRGCVCRCVVLFVVVVETVARERDVRFSTDGYGLSRRGR